MCSRGFEQREAAESLEHAKPLLQLCFEGDLADALESRRTCTAHGTVTFVAGRHGKCAAFDGQSWIDTGVAQQELGDEFTVECWVNPDKQQNVHADIFGNHDAAGLGFVLQQDAGSTNHFQAAYGAGAGKWVLADPVQLAPGQWQHVALVKTHGGLQFYLNSVLVAEVTNDAPVLPSPMRVAVGLGYRAPERCFRGLIDDFCVWNRALTSFEHAGIDPASVRETRAQCLEATPRSPAGAATRSWTLATDDTRMTLDVTAEGQMVIRELACPAGGMELDHRTRWRSVSGRSVEVAGESKTLQWRFVDAVVDESDGRKLSLRFASDDPALEVVSQWHAQPGRGPIHHSVCITNRSQQAVTLGEQPTFDIDLAGAATMWCFHSDGITPDAVGVYRHPLARTRWANATR